MQIIFMRHGEAVYRAATDGERPLNELGHQQALSTGQQLGEWLAGRPVDNIIVSPYVRAQETCQNVMHAASLHEPVITFDGIRPACNARDALDYLATIPGELVLVVCHMSIVAFMVSILTGEEPAGFELAEARVLQLDNWTPGQATVIRTILPR